MGNDSKNEIWVAQDSDSQFSAGCPLELLGLIAMYQQRGDAWKASDQEINAYLGKYYPSGLESSG